MVVVGDVVSETTTLKFELTVLPALFVAVTICDPGVAAPGL